MGKSLGSFSQPQLVKKQPTLGLQCKPTIHIHKHTHARTQAPALPCAPGQKQPPGESLVTDPEIPIQPVMNVERRCVLWTQGFPNNVFFSKTKYLDKTCEDDNLERDTDSQDLEFISCFLNGGWSLLERGSPVLSARMKVWVAAAPENVFFHSPGDSSLR